VSAANYFTVNFPSSDMPASRVAEVDLFQERFKHDYARVRFRDWNTAYDSIRPGSPMKLVFKDRTSSKEFVGYVHHIEHNFAPGLNYTDVFFISASYALKQPSQKVYKNGTADQIVQSIAKDFNFAWNTVPHPRVFPQIAHAGVSAWDFLKKLAHHTGYSLRVENTTIHFQPVTTQFNQNKITAPTFNMRSQSNPAGSTLYSFKLIAGESLDQAGEMKAATAVSGVDRNTAKVIQVTNQARKTPLRPRFQPEFFDAFAHNTVASDIAMAKSEAEAVDERTRFAYRAEAEVIGTPNLSPDQPVYMDGVGKDYSGYWVVLGVQHKLISTAYNVQQYTTILQLGSDSLGKTANQGGVFTNMVARNIVPGVRQTSIKPVNQLKQGIPSPSKNSSVGFGKVMNRNAGSAVNASQAVVASKWTNPSGSLNTTTVVNSRPASVVRRLKANGYI